MNGSRAVASMGAMAVLAYNPFVDRGAVVPVFLTRFIGRAAEVERLCALVALPEVRLVTLTGPGGVGKTRLALEAAGSLGDAFPGGVYFVGLASLTEPELIVPSVAQALGVSAEARTPLVNLLRAYLSERRALLLLDNFEHLLSGAPAVAELLAACHGLTVLATSRAPLRVSGEREVAVRPLPVPGETGDAGAPAGDAITLFLERARDVLPDFAPDPEELRAILAICRLADGLPLAIELAAARLRLWPPLELARRLRERPLALLSGGFRDAPARHRTLRDTIAWSYDLLPEAAQRALRRLSVLAGPWTLDAAAAVCAPECSAAEPRGKADRAAAAGAGIIDVVQLLVENGLVQRAQPHAPHAVPAADSVSRFALLETVREFGLERLQSTGEEQSARARHAAYFLRLIAPVLQAPAEPWSPPYSATRTGVELDLPDLRAAAGFQERAGQHLQALQLAMVVVSQGVGTLPAARTWIERLLTAVRGAAAAGTTEGMRVRAYALAFTALVASSQHDLRGMEAAAQACLRLAEALGEVRQISQAITLLGTRAAMAGQYDAAAGAAERVLAMGPPPGSHARVVALRNLGIAERERGYWSETGRQNTGGAAGAAFPPPGGAPPSTRHYDAAESWFRRSHEEARTRHDRARVMEHLAVLALYRGDPARARGCLAASLNEAAIFGEPGFDRRLAWLAATEASAGHWKRATQLLGAASRHEGATWREYPMERAYLERAFAAIWARQVETGDDDAAGMPPLTVQEAVALFLSTRPDDGDAPTGARRPHDARRAPVGGRLSPREHEVATWIARGMTNPEIAAALRISQHTTLRHVEHIMAKLGVNRRAQIAAWVAERRAHSDRAHQVALT